MSIHSRDKRQQRAIKVFEGTNITTVDGFRVLGSVIGTPSPCDKYMETEIENIATLTSKISKIAKTKHHHKMYTPAT